MIVAEYVGKYEELKNKNDANLKEYICEILYTMFDMEAELMSYKSGLSKLQNELDTANMQIDVTNTENYLDKVLGSKEGGENS